MNAKSISIIALTAFAVCSPAIAAPPVSESGIEKYNVVWDSPSQNSLGSMPIGNGDISANVWVEPSGDLVLLLSKTDAFDEFNRLLKLGRLRIKTTLALARDGQPFEQTLRLQDGTIVIKSNGTTTRIWVDANNPVMQVDMASDNPIKAEVSLEVWRTEPRELNRVSGREKEAHSAAYNRPEKMRVNPDVILPHGGTQLAWCHHNNESQWQANLELTALGDEVAKGTDPIIHRTFGAVVRGSGMKAVSDTVLQSESPAKAISVRIFPLTQTADSPAEWLKAAATMADGITASSQERFAAHTKWWHHYWTKSWIKIDGENSLPMPHAKNQPRDLKAGGRQHDADAQIVSRAYALQRFINACAGRSALPIKFNGSIFTVDQVFDPDYRRWGGAYWWQNTRLIYWGMLYSGDYDLMRPLFNMYRDTLPLRKAATRKYYGHDGAFYPETMYFWGNFTDENYGIDRTGKPDGLTDNTYIRRYWQGGLELVAMMLDYHDATQDAEFRDKSLLPLATEITRFFDQHWQRGADGKVFYSPAQSLETWHDATDPTPEIVGLRYLLPRLLALPASPALKAEWRKQLADQPEIPTTTTKDGETRILPAKTYSKSENFENPELYAVFPYRAYTLAQGGEALKTGINTWKSRRQKDNSGWQQQPIQAALLGLTSEAKALTVQRPRNTAAGYRFPGFYGPNFDWVPDQDHVSVFQIGLQRMLMQCEGDRILLLPAWPEEWNVHFKLHAPGQTTIEAQVKDGKVVDLKVHPESRRGDVEIRKPFVIAL
jgi:hypothetical protein